jgi:MFS family permease
MAGSRLRDGRRSARRWDRQAVSVLVVLVIDSTVSGIFIPISLLYLSASSGASLLEVGTLLSVAGVVSLPLPLWIGRLVDQVGPKEVILVSQALQAVGFLVYLIAWNRAAVFLAALVASLGQRAFWSSIFTLVSNLSDRDTGDRSRERWFGVIGSLRAAGYGAGALMAGIALSVELPAVTEGVIAANALLLIAAAIVIGAGIHRADFHGSAPSAIQSKPSFRLLWNDRPYLGLVALNTIFALCNLMLGIALAPFVSRQFPSIGWATGPLLAMNTILQAVLQAPVTRWLRRLTRKRSLCLAAVLWASWAFVTAASSWVPQVWRIPSLTVAVLCYAAAQLVHSPVSNALAADAAPASVRGRYLAVFQYSFAIAGLIAAPMFSALLEVSSATPWSVLAILALLTIPGIMLLAPRLPDAALAGTSQKISASATPHPDAIRST